MIKGKTRLAHSSAISHIVRCLMSFKNVAFRLYGGGSNLSEPKGGPGCWEVSDRERESAGKFIVVLE